MDEIEGILDNIMMEIPLSSEQEIIFIEQIKRFNELSKKNIEKRGLLLDSKGKLFFKKGTLIHGANNFDYTKIDSISKSGILTGQAIGISEDGETYYCADFHRVKDDVSCENYNANFTFKDGRCPFGRRADISKSISFVISPNDMNQELFSYDCYRDTTHGLATRSFVKSMPLVDDKDAAASILYGVPANCIEGIIVGGKIINDREKIDYLIEKFPNCYVATCFGELLYDSSKKEVSIKEFIELQREKAINDSYRRLNEKLMKQKEVEIEKLQNENKKMIDMMFQVLGNEDIRKILLGIGWQVVSDQYIDERKNKK